MFKRKLIILVGILILVFNINVYADEIIPNDVIRNELSSGAKQIVKIYDLAPEQELQVDISDFSEDEDDYHYINTESNEIIETDDKEISHAIELETSSNDANYILSKLDETIDYTTDDEYMGTLTLDKESINTEVKGYSTSSYLTYENRSYPNLPTNDVAYIPKSLNANGYTYTLDNVTWEFNAVGSIAPNTYTANTTYVRTATSTNPTGYITTANYKGTGTKTTKDVVEYKVIYQTDAIQVEQTVDTQENNNETNAHISFVGYMFSILFAIILIIILILLYFKFLHSKVKERLEDRKIQKEIEKGMINNISDEDVYDNEDENIQEVAEEDITSEEATEEVIADDYYNDDENYYNN